MVRQIRLITFVAFAFALSSVSPRAQAKRTAKPPAKPPVAKPLATTDRAAPPSESSGMTNGDVIKLVQAGIGESVVMTAVRTAAKTMFQLDADNLIALKKAGVSDNIVAVMLDPKAAPAAAASAVVAPLPLTGGNLDTRARVSDPHAAVETPRDPGIYIDLGDDKPNLVALEPTVFRMAKPVAC